MAREGQHWTSPNLVGRRDTLCSLDESLRQLDVPGSRLLPDLHSGDLLVVGSDYAGHHRSASYECISVIIADIQRCEAWEHLRAGVRLRYSLHSRRMAYKALNDRRRRGALPSFLEAAGHVPGLLFNLLVDKSVPTLFEEKPGRQTDTESLFHGWKPRVTERALRTMHLVGFLLAGLSRPMQNVTWVTDEDEIVANEQRLRRFVEAFARIGSHYLTHHLRHLRIATTASDPGDRQLEDLVAIPDLAAGALVDVVGAYGATGLDSMSSMLMPISASLPKKVRPIVYWLAGSKPSLTQLTYVLDEEPDSGSPRLQRLNFHAWTTAP